MRMKPKRIKVNYFYNDELTNCYFICRNCKVVGVQKQLDSRNISKLSNYDPIESNICDVHYDRMEEIAKELLLYVDKVWNKECYNCF